MVIPYCFQFSEKLLAQCSHCLFYTAAYKHQVPAVCIKSEKVFFMPQWNTNLSLRLWDHKKGVFQHPGPFRSYTVRGQRKRRIWQILTQFWIKQLVWLHFMWLFWKRCMIMLCLWPECYYCSILYSRTFFLNYLKEILDSAWQLVLFSFTRQDFREKEMP